jgi:hypothetical protein
MQLPRANYSTADSSRVHPKWTTPRLRDRSDWALDKECNRSQNNEWRPRFKLWRALSRLNRSRLLLVNTNFAGFCKIYKMYALVQRLKLNNFAKPLNLWNIVNMLTNICHIWSYLMNCCRMWAFFYFPNFKQGLTNLMKFTNLTINFVKRLPIFVEITNFV